MAIKKMPDGRWFVDIEPVKGKRFRRYFATKAEGRRFEVHVRDQYGKRESWQPVREDRRRLSELVEIWYGQHGIHLADPERRKRSLDNMVASLGDPVAKKLSSAEYLNYRKSRALKGVSAKTLNNELGYLRAMYNYLWRTDQVAYQCPLAKVQPIRVKDRELSFLSLSQCGDLLSAIERQGNCCLYLVVRVCLETGARWSEAETLRHSQLGIERITYTDTKSGRNRTVPITGALEAELRRHRCGRGQLFATSISAFRRVFKKCGFSLPKGQASHALRHTYASHFMMNGGDILTLQKLLGHSSINLTMRYAHLSPGHMADAVQYRPKIEFDSLSTDRDSKSKSP